MKVKMKNKSTPQVRVDISKKGLILPEIHKGERTYAKDMERQMVKLLNEGYSIIPCGDNLNADDLRKSGIVTTENVQDQMDEFDKLISPYHKQMPALMQSNHDGSRIYSKHLSRQHGGTLVSKWEGILAKYHNTVIVSAERPELEFILGTPIRDFKCLLVHPSGLKSANAYINRLKKNYALSTYDYIFVAHFHEKTEHEAVKRAFGNTLDSTEIVFIPPMIEDPNYGVGKGYSPSHAGFTVVTFVQTEVERILGRKGHIQIEFIQRK